MLLSINFYMFDVFIIRNTLFNFFCVCPGSLDKLMASTLSDLGNSSSPSAKRHTFKKPAYPLNTGATSQSRTTESKTFMESTKARSWSLDTAALDGVFAQHVQVTPPSHDTLSEDHFGEFQSCSTKDHLLGASGQSGGKQERSNSFGQQTTHTAIQQQFLPPQSTHHYNAVITTTHCPVPATSISGWTKKGYISSDCVQSRSYPGYAIGDPTSSNKQNAQSSTAATNFSGLNMSKFPSVYMEVYRRCGQLGDGRVSTDLLFPLLLSSQVPRPVLKNLWELANRGVPGKLSQAELFVLLGLIALVQV